MESTPDLSALLDSQRAYFNAKLKTSTASVRIARLKKLQKWIMANRAAIREALMADLRKPAHEADVMEIMPTNGEINDAIAHLRDWMRPRRVSTPLYMAGSSAMVYHEPKGCSLILGPFNYPFMLTVGPLVSAIAAGCTAIIKPSESTPASSELVKKMCEAIFSPEEVSCVLGDYTVAQALTALRFDHVFFTGSPEVGKKVMHAAADHLSSVTLELGGRNPAIVDETASIEDAARKLVWGKFVNGGASCMSPNYIMVQEKIHDKMVEAIVRKYKEYYGNTPEAVASCPDFTRVVNSRHVQRLESLLSKSVEQGAELLVGGQSDPASNYFAPTILKGVKPSHEIFKEEVFGPVMSLMKYKDLDEAIELIRGIDKPLGLYIFSTSSRNINRVISETSSGSMMVNETTVAFGHPGIPFGGVNVSGLGKAHGHAGYLAFTNEKPVMRQNRWLPFTLLVFPPYTGLKNKLINFVIRWL